MRFNRLLHARGHRPRTQAQCGEDRRSRDILRGQQFLTVRLSRSLLYWACESNSVPIKGGRRFGRFLRSLIELQIGV